MPLSPVQGLDISELGCHASLLTTLDPSKSSRPPPRTSPSSLFLERLPSALTPRADFIHPLPWGELLLEAAPDLHQPLWFRPPLDP